jgi:hypothetical protein
MPSAIPWCCWKPLWIPGISAGPSIKRQIGSMWATPRVSAVPAKAIVVEFTHRRWFSSNPCDSMRRHCCPDPFSNPPIAQEAPRSCHRPSRCKPCPVSLPILRSRAVPKGDVIGSPPCWPLPPGPFCAGCAATGPCRTGPIALAPRRVSDFAAVAKTVATIAWQPQPSHHLFCKSGFVENQDTFRIAHVFMNKSMVLLEHKLFVKHNVTYKTLHRSNISILHMKSERFNGLSFQRTILSNHVKPEVLPGLASHETISKLFMESIKFIHETFYVTPV